MKIKKGEFKVATKDGVVYRDGSYATCYPFYIHRDIEEHLWTLSHLATGYNIKKGMTLADARSLARYLKTFPLFLVPTIDTFTKQLEIHKTKNPTKHAEMLKRITGN